jgi:hypothetical protein
MLEFMAKHINVQVVNTDPGNFTTDEGAIRPRAIRTLQRRSVRKQPAEQRRCLPN